MMTFAPISMVPTKGKKADKGKSPLSLLPQENLSKEKKIKNSTSLFTQMLTQIATNNPPQTHTPKTKTHKPKGIAQAPITAAQKPLKSPQKLLTQHKLAIQNKRGQEAPRAQNQLHEALMLKKEQKTLGDIQKIAQDNRLNLNEIQLTQSKSKGPKSKTSSQPNISSKPQHLDQVIPQKSKKIKKIRETKQNQHNPIQQNQAQSPQELTQKASQELQASLRETTLATLLSQKGTEKPLSKEALGEKLLGEKIEEAKSEKAQEPLLGELKKETQFKITQSRETLTHFTQRLKEEIINYKPPFTRLSMELNPKELGKLEVTITKKGKELQISINANNPNALQAFVQNQSEFRSSLATAGFESIDLSFSQGQDQGHREQNPRGNQKGNKNSLGNLIDAPAISSMEIKMVQYA